MLGKHIFAGALVLGLAPSPSSGQEYAKLAEQTPRQIEAYNKQRQTQAKADRVMGDYIRTCLQRDPTNKIIFQMSGDGQEITAQCYKNKVTNEGGKP